MKINIYMIPLTRNIFYPQSCLCYLSLKQSFEFKKFYYHSTYGEQRYQEYFYLLFHQNVKALSEQTCMIRMQYDVKIPASNPAVIA